MRKASCHPSTKDIQSVSLPKSGAPCLTSCKGPHHLPHRIIGLLQGDLIRKIVEDHLRRKVLGPKNPWASHGRAPDKPFGSPDHRPSSAAITGNGRSVSWCLCPHSHFQAGCGSRSDERTGSPLARSRPAPALSKEWSRCCKGAALQQGAVGRIL